MFLGYEQARLSAACPQNQLTGGLNPISVVSRSAAWNFRPKALRRRCEAHQAALDLLARQNDRTMIMKKNLAVVDLPMRYGSVCSGIEAATVAWHPLDWQPVVLFAEIEKFLSGGAGASLPWRAQLGRHHQIQGMARCSYRCSRRRNTLSKVFPSRDFAKDWLTLAETSVSPSLQSLTGYRPQ